MQDMQQYIWYYCSTSMKHIAVLKTFFAIKGCVSRSEVPASRNVVDITIEQTINRHAKSSGGIIGFSRNLAAYHRWCVTRHTRASYVEATFELADMTSSESKAHKDIRPTKVIATEKDVVKILDSFSNFINPFEVDNKDVLFYISSGAPATKDIQDDLLRADEVGQNALSKFIKERLVEKNVSFHSPLSRQDL